MARTRGGSNTVAAGEVLCPKCQRKSVVVNDQIAVCLRKDCPFEAIGVAAWHCRWPNCDQSGVQAPDSLGVRGVPSSVHYMSNHYGHKMPGGPPQAWLDEQARLAAPNALTRTR